MGFIAAKCPECGGAIQLDNARESGFCMYCGTRVVLSEAVPLNVRVEGIQTLENKLKNAETYAKLGEVEKAFSLLSQITEEYTSDYRAWWMLAKVIYAYDYFYKNKDAGLVDKIINSREYKYYTFLLNQEPQAHLSEDYCMYAEQIANNKAESQRKIEATHNKDYYYINHCYQNNNGFEVVDEELYFWETAKCDGKLRMNFTKVDVSRLNIHSIHDGLITFRNCEIYKMCNEPSEPYKLFCQRNTTKK